VACSSRIAPPSAIGATSTTSSRATRSATRFRNNTTEFEILGGHRRHGRLSGSVGGWVLNAGSRPRGPRRCRRRSTRSRPPRSCTRRCGWPHFTLQFGGRLEHTRFQPQGGLPNREFTNLSGSVGLLYRPPAVRDAITLALSVARAARNPALEELYFFGEHPATSRSRSATRARVGEGDRARRVVPVAAARIAGEFTYFRNSINDYIFRSPISEEEFEERFGHDDDHGHGHGHEDEFAYIEFTPADSLLQGFEVHTDVQVAHGLTAELGMDYVRGQLRRTGDPLPRIPPLRVKGGLRYQWNALQAGGEVVSAARQTRVFGEETETDGYSRLRLFGVLLVPAGAQRQHHHRAARQRDQHALPEPPLLHQGPGAGDGAQLQAALQRPLLRTDAAVWS
jgi:iron complex outermembrane recepter protein